MKICIFGSSGRMGIELIKAVIESKHDLCGAFVKLDSKFLGKDVSDLLNISDKKGVIFSNDIDHLCEKADVIIDFSSPTGSLQLLNVAKIHKVPVVCGTTGFSENEFSLLKEVSNHIPIFWSANMSLGINVIAEVLKLVINKLKGDFDVEITDSHHKYKKDSPSGTAIMLGKVIADAKNIDFNKSANFNRNFLNRSRQSHEIGFSSIRAGGICGEHSVIFADENEEIVITHKALNRRIFAQGAIKAAECLFSKLPGLYSSY